VSYSIGRIFRGAINRAPYVRHLVQRLRHFERFCPIDHFYSPIVNVAELARRDAQVFRDTGPVLPGIDLKLPEQLQLLQEFAMLARDAVFPETAADGARYYSRNDFYGLTDATLLNCFIRWLKPRRIIEVGSGFSSCVVLDTVGKYLSDQVECTFIDPDPQRLRLRCLKGDLERVKLIPSLVQDVPLSAFSELRENDILFIDSSHVAKAGSDVNYLFFEVLPALHAGVHVHVHDVFYPFEYPRQWIYDGRSWNEAYLLRAFLQYNSSYALTCFPSHLEKAAPEQFAAALPQCVGNPGQCLWMKKTA
jgi:hypothetical protein